MVSAGNTSPAAETYLTPEAQARIEIDRMLSLAGWAVQDADRVGLAAARGVAVREFVLSASHGRADYLLFVEHFADQAAYDAHTGSQAYAEFIAGKFSKLIVEFVEKDHELLVAL